MSENAFDSAKWEATSQRAIRTIYGGVLVERAPHLHAGLCRAEMPAIEVAQMLVVSQPPGWPWMRLYLVSKKMGKLPGPLLVE